MQQPKMKFSEIVENIPEAMSIYINQIVYSQKRKGENIIVLSLGEAFFDIPMFDFSKIDFVKGYHYSDSRGILELREKIAAFYKKEYSAEINPDDEILVSTGSKSVIYFAMQATLNLGDEVLIHEPGWLSYQEQARIVGAVPKFIPYDCEVKDFHKYFTDKTRMFVINNPNNPAGRIYTLDELKTLYAHCQKHGIYILIDEAYSDFVIEDEFHTMAKIVSNKEGVIIINSLSKNLGMSGWRIGYVIATPELIKQILKLNQHIITCAPTILEYYIAEYFDDIISITLPQVKEVVKKRQRIAKMMDEIKLDYMKTKSSFYFMVSIGDFSGNSLEFALYLLLYKHIAVVPGSAYGESVSRFVRLSIGTESETDIKEALLIIKELIDMKDFNPKIVYKKLEEEGYHLFKQV